MTWRIDIDYRRNRRLGHAVVIPDRVWDYVRNDLPGLRRIVQAPLAEMEPPEA